MFANNTIKDIIFMLEKELKLAGIPDAAFEASLILEAFSGFDRVQQIVHPEWEVTESDMCRITSALRSRCQHKPLSHILGEVYFYGRPFYVNDAVLAPRADTEHLVDHTLKQIELSFPNKQKLDILDTCCGSGAIGISIWLEEKAKNRVHDLLLLDISTEAIAVARRNADRHGLTNAELSVVVADFWPENAGEYDVITCNPPYVDAEEMLQLMPEVAEYEPTLALYGGQTGLIYYQRLAKEAANYLKPGGFLAIEHGYRQREPLQEIFASASWRILGEFDDYGHNPRVMLLAPL